MKDGGILPPSLIRLKTVRKHTIISDMTMTQQILKAISALPQGEPFISSRFLTYGSRANVDQSLSRLVKRRKITRIARGIYVKPKYNRFVGAVLPEPLKIVQILSQETNSIVQVNGAEAARQLGLSTQMSTHPVFLTSGQSRRFHIGELEIILKHVTPRKLACAGTRAGLAITALWYLGKHSVKLKTIETIKKQLTKKEYESFKNSLGNMPEWLNDIIRRYEQGQGSTHDQFFSKA